MNTLADIYDYKRSQYKTIERLAKKLTPTPCSNASRFDPHQPGIHLIAEIKKASPTVPDLAPKATVDTRAKQYTSAGAAMISVLTENQWFSGRYADLKAASQATVLPILNKDFILFPEQITIARHCGATHILLIAAMLKDSELEMLFQHAKNLGLAVLFEVHELADYRRIRDFPVPYVGINNRNLKTLEVDIGTSLKLLPHIDPKHAIISESGIRDQRDIRRLFTSGIRSFLVGETLMRHSKPEELIRQFLEVAHET